MRWIWTAGLVYQSLWIAALSYVAMQSDEELMRPPRQELTTQQKRLGVTLMLMAMVVGALGTLGFLAAGVGM